MKNTTNMAELMKKVNAYGQPQNLDEGFASDAQRRAAFAQGYKAKGKKDKKDEEVLDEAKATLSRFGGDRLKDSIMNLAKQRGLKVKDLGKDKIEISGNQKVVMAITLAVQKKDVKINEEAELDEKFSPKEIKMAIGVASDPRYKRGNMTGAIKAIEKIKKGLSDHPQVSAVLQRQNEEVDIQEDGHTDVASAIRQCKTIVEDAMQITSKLQTMNPEDSLPSWWTNKLAVSSNSMNKLRDYFLVPTTEEVELDEKKVFKPEEDAALMKLYNKAMKQVPGSPAQKKTLADIQKHLMDVSARIRNEDVQIDLDEKAGDIPDLKNLVGELVKASGMHLAQSKRVQAHVDMMTKANAKGPEGAGGLADLKKIVGELQKASEAHKRQSKSIDAHIKFMGETEIKEYIEDELDEGYEKEVLLILKDAGISGSFRSGRLYVDKQDVKDARSALKDSDKFKSLPRIVGEEVELDEQFEYVLVDKDNKVIGVFGTKQRAKDFEPKAKKQPALKNRLPLRIQPIKPKSKKVGDTVIGIGEEVETANTYEEK